MIVHEPAGPSLESQELLRAWRALMRIKTPSPNLIYLRAALRERMVLLGVSIGKDPKTGRTQLSKKLLKKRPVPAHE